MKLSVYYDEIEGKLYPKLLLVPAEMDKQYATYSIEAPFCRFYSEDFNESVKIISVSQGALTRDPFNPSCFSIFIPQVIKDLSIYNDDMSLLNDADYFMIQMEDLEEVMKMIVKKKFAHESR